MTVAEDVAAHIAASLGPPWVVGVNVFSGPEQPPSEAGQAFPIPSEAIFIVQVNAFDSSPLKDGTKLRFPVCQILYRGPRNVWGVAVATAEEVLATVDFKPPVGYFECRSVEGFPLPIEKTDAGEPRFTINIRLDQEPVSW